MPQRNGTTPAKSSHAAFYADVLRLIKKLRIPFRVGGTCALNAYIGLARETKDLDIFCRPGDYPRIIRAASEAGFKTEVEDERWLAKIRRGKAYCDVIFGSANMVAPITDDWFREIHHATFWNVRVRVLPPTELIWSKAFIIDRYKYDGNDIAHIILRKEKLINWRKLLAYMDQHWEVLLIHLLYFRYIYPSERDLVPEWLKDELLSRLHMQAKMPSPRLRVCRGRIFSRDDFEIDIAAWGFADLIGDQPH